MTDKKNDKLFFDTYGNNPLKNLYPKIKITSITREELAQELAFVYSGCAIFKDSFYLNLAGHALTHFDIRRKKND